MDDPVFIGFGAFETTAFLTSVLVALYSLLANPTGRQGASDQAEYNVYAGWRSGLIVISAQLVLTLIVLLVQVSQKTVPSTPKVWLILLMIAPWAPLAGKVRDNLTAGAKVRRMMKSRLLRNELAATLRDRFKFGQRALTLLLVIDHVIGARHLPDADSTPPLAALRRHTALAPLEAALCEQATKNAQTGNPRALALGALWTVNQGGQPSSVARSRLWLWRAVVRLDLLARAWTGRSLPLRADPMPELDAAARVAERALVLDVIDGFQQGGTVSDELMQRTMVDAFCERCRLSTRAAVEAFLESAAFGHTDLRASVWLRDVEMDWRGNFERVMDVMWEAAFIEGKGIKVEGKDDKSRSFGDRNKVTTTKVLALLFLVVRALVHSDGEPTCYSRVCSIVHDGPCRERWWSRYWDKVADALPVAPGSASSSDVEKGGEVKLEVGNGTVLKGALRDVIDEDMLDVVSAFVEDCIDGNEGDFVCQDETCYLRSAKLEVRKVT